jgi:hypothetical protein
VTKSLAWGAVSFWKTGTPKWKAGRLRNTAKKSKNKGCYDYDKEEIYIVSFQ